MTWWPLMDRVFSEAELREGFGALFDLSPEDFAFLDEEGELQSVSDSIPVIIRRYQQSGDFPEALEIVLRRPEIWDRDEADGMRFFCRRMNCSCLVGDDTLHPDRWVLIEPTGKTRVVILDGEAIDERDEYIIDHDAVDTWPDSGFWESRFRNPSD